MANIYKHKKTNKLYTIEHFIKNIRFAIGNRFKSIIASPYRWKGNNIVYRRKDNIVFNSEKIIQDNFVIIGEVW